jgi:VanZ family protein
MGIAHAKRVPLWIWWIPVVWVISFPWGDLTRSPQWHRVHPLPFSDPADELWDLSANLLLFVPFGYSFVRSRRRPAVIGAMLAAAAVSITAEASQLFSTDRFPSGTDVAAAVVGSLAGAVWAVGRKRAG